MKYCRNHNLILFASTAAVLTAAVVLSFFCGRYPLSVGEMAAALVGRGDQTGRFVLLGLRLPRTLMAVLSGAALGMAGCVYQTMFDNPLASPDLIGVAGGANLGAAVMIVLGSGSAVAVMGGSFIGALCAVALVLALSAAAGKGKLSFILGGIIVNAVSSALIMALKAFADPEQQLASIEYWEMGSLGAVTLPKIAPSVICTVFALAAMIVFSNAVTLLSLGDDECRALGVRVTPVRVTVLAVNTLLVASVVSVTGLISFVGLVAPHIAGLLLPQKGKRKMILSALLGGIVVTGADLLVRVVGKTELPLSVLTAVTGIPVLVALLLKRGNRLG